MSFIALTIICHNFNQFFQIFFHFNVLQFCDILLLNAFKNCLKIVSNVGDKLTFDAFKIIDWGLNSFETYQSSHNNIFSVCFEIDIFFQKFWRIEMSEANIVNSLLKYSFGLRFDIKFGFIALHIDSLQSFNVLHP